MPHNILDTILGFIGLVITIGSIVFAIISWSIKKTFYNKEQIDKKMSEDITAFKADLEEDLKAYKEQRNQDLKEFQKALLEDKKEFQTKVEESVSKIYNIINDKANKEDVRRLEEKLDLKAGKDDVLRLESKVDRMTEVIVEFKAVLAYKNECEK